MLALTQLIGRVYASLTAGQSGSPRALLVFGFGLSGERRERHGHAPPLEAVILVDLADLGELLFDAAEDLLALIKVGKLPSSEAKRELHPVAAGKEITSTLNLDAKIMLADLGRFYADFLKFRLTSGGLGLLLLLPLGILPLAVIHNAADWRSGSWGDLDKIQPRLTRAIHGVAHIHDAHLLIVLVYKTNGRNANLLIATKTLFDDRSP